MRSGLFSRGAVIASCGLLLSCSGSAADETVGVVRVGAEAARTNTIMAIEKVRLDLRQCFERHVEAAAVIADAHVPPAVFDAIADLQGPCGSRIRFVDARVQDPDEAEKEVRRELERIYARPDVTSCTVPRWKNYGAVASIRSESVRAKGALVIDAMMVGDSITAGWPAEVLKRHFPDWQIRSLACSGDAVQDQLGSCTWGGLDGYRAKIVQVMIGTNNALNDNPTNVAAGITRLVETVKAKQPEATVFLMPIFPSREAGEKNRHRAETDAVNAMIRPLADGKRVVWFELYDEWLDEKGNCRKDLFRDGLHPNGAGYELWATKMKPLWEKARADWKGDPAKTVPCRVTDRKEVEKRIVFTEVATNVWEAVLPVAELVKYDAVQAPAGDFGPGLCVDFDIWLNRHPDAQLLIHAMESPSTLSAADAARVAGVNDFFCRWTRRWSGQAKFCPFPKGDPRSAPYVAAMKAHPRRPKTANAIYRGPTSFCSNEWWTRGVLHQQMIDRGEVKDTDILFWGDSITHTWECRGTNALETTLGGYRIFNIAVSGDIVQGCIWNAENGLLDGYRTKSVMLMIGTNNGGRPDIVPGVKRLLDLLAEKQPQATVFLLPIFPRGADYAKGEATAEKLGTNDQLKELCDGKRVRFVDFNDKFLIDGKLTKDVFPDFVHPNARGFQIWADAMKPHFVELLGDWRGKLAWRTASEVGASRVSVGFECLDRGLYDPEKCYGPLAVTGTKYARCQTGWFRCEREKGKYDFAWLDGVVDNHLKRGVEPWFNVGFGNPLYMTNCYSKAAVGHVPLYYGEACQRAWCDYVRALAKHFKGRVRRWEVWNEPNNSAFWVPRKPDAKEYVRLIGLTAPIIREEIPGARVGACVSSVYEPFTGEFADRGGGKGLDFFAVHPYATAPEHLMHWEAKMSYLDAIADIRRRFAKGGAPDIEIWNGESGYNGWFPKRHWLYYNDEEIEDFDAPAKWLLRRFVLDRRAGCALSSYFIIADFTRPYEKSSTTWKKPPLCGLLDGLTYRPRPAYFALGNYNALLADADWAEDVAFEVACGDKRVRTMAVPLRRGDGKVCFAYWAVTDTMRQAFGRRDDAWAALPEKFRPKDPVLVDLKTGDVWGGEVDGPAAAHGLAAGHLRSHGGQTALIQGMAST